MNCDVVKDLLPLYHDGVCSEESRILVEEHLKECEDCREYLEEIGREIFQPVKEEVKIIDVLKILRKKFFKKRTIIVLGSIILAFAFLIGGYQVGLNYEIPVKYEDTENALEIIQHFFAFPGKDPAIIRDFHRVTLLINTVGDENYIYAYYTKTLINDNRRAYGTTMLRPAYFYYGNIKDIDPSDYPSFGWNKISAVYYLIGDFHKLSTMDDEEFAEATKDAVLVWEK